MERPDRLGAVFAITVSLAALSVYLLTQVSLPQGSTPSADPPLVTALLALAGVSPTNMAGRHFLAAAGGAAGVGLLYVLFRQSRIERSAAAWLTVAFAFGTVHWWAAATGEGPGLAHVAAVMLATAALLVALTGRWPLLCGLLLGAAAAARLPMVLTLPLFVALYAARPAGDATVGRKLAERLVAVAPLGVGLLLPLVYLGFVTHGPYHPANVPQHLHAALLRSFDLAAEAPWFRPNLIGASLLLTTPVYLWLVRARSPAPVVLWSWVAVALVALAGVLSADVGSPQFGYRPSLDAMPLLFVLLGWVFRDGMSTAARAAVLLAVAVNTYAMIAVGILDPPFAGW